MANLSDQDLAERDTLAAHLMDASPVGRPAPDLTQLLAGIEGRPPERLTIDFPQGARPTPEALAQHPNPSAPLPQADVIAIAYTVAEAAALSDVLTPGVDYKQWYNYARDYAAHYRPLVGPGGPSLSSGRLGSFYPLRVKDKSVLVMKSELHLARDKKRLPDGSVSLPIRDFFKQIIVEVRPEVVVTTGTAGGASCDQHLGDVVVTRAGRFLCSGWYADEPFNKQTFASRPWSIPSASRAATSALMQGYAGNLSGGQVPPETRCGCGSATHPTRILVDGEGGIPAGKPILTTDTFDYGTSTNGYGALGLACEMDDAVLGMVCADDLAQPPLWASVRNLSDPCINGTLSKADQVNCAAKYYEIYGYWTSVMSALVCWSIVASL